VRSLEDLTGDWLGAVVIYRQAGANDLVFPAAFLFDAPDGVAWVEPSYADPIGAASPAFHRRQGQRTAPGRFVGNGWTIDLLPYDPAEDRDLIGDALDWFAGWLKAEGRTWAQERERVRALVADELA
jgi:hypothetical protein